MVYFIVVYLSFSSKMPMIGVRAFAIIFVFITYHFCFNLFYIIALVENCIKINEIKGKCNVISQLEKSEIDVVNELRIDYLLAIILKESGIKRDDMLSKMFDMIDMSNISEPQKIKDYLKSYYP